MTQRQPLSPKRRTSAILPAAVALLATILFWLLYDLTPYMVTANKKKLEEMGL